MSVLPQRGQKRGHKSAGTPQYPPKRSGAPLGIARNSFIYTRTNIGNILQNTQLKTILRARERAADGQKRNRGRAGVAGETQRGGPTTPAQSQGALRPIPPGGGWFLREALSPSWAGGSWGMSPSPTMKGEGPQLPPPPNRHPPRLGLRPRGCPQCWGQPGWCPLKTR